MNFIQRGMTLASAVVLAACGGGEVGGTITGLTNAGLVLTNGSETINVAANATSFTFPTGLDDGKAYAVSVVTQPAGLQCGVTNGTGVASSSAVVNNVVVTCVAVFSVSGTVAGLTRAGLVLNLGGEDLAVAAPAPSFAFVTRLPTGAEYLVTVKTQPTGQACSVSSGGGVVGAVAVADVAVRCN